MLASVPELRDRVEERLRSILETAVEMLHTQREFFVLDGHLRLYVADYVISYTLDLDQHVAKIIP
jgi:hypothetical protein